MLSTIIILLLTSLASSSTLYAINTKVTKLTPNNFDSLVKSSNDIWIIEIFSSQCKPCIDFVEHFEDVAVALEGTVKCGAINSDEHVEMLQEFSIEDIPTIQIFRYGQAIHTYTGERTTSDLVDFVMKNIALNEVATTSPECENMIELTDENFETVVIQSDDAWLVELYDPSDLNCQKLASAWKEVARELEGKVRAGALDVTTNLKFLSRYEVQYPAIIFFPPGNAHKDFLVYYASGKSSCEIVTWAVGLLAKYLPATKVVQLINFDSLKAACERKPLCVVTVLPHILDCQSQCRKQYLEIIEEVVTKFNKNPWGWVWVEAGAQKDVEDALEIGGPGYPALAAVSVKKMQYFPFHGSFSVPNLVEFFINLGNGHETGLLLTVTEVPLIVETRPWNGKDAMLDLDLGKTEYPDVDVQVKDEL